MIELMSPAGNWPSLRAAIDAGADSIYFGVKNFNMRANAQNFELSELKKVVNECHKVKVKAYLTINTILYDNELQKLKTVLKEAKKAKIDAIIAWDFAVLAECKKLKLPIILSTQASVSNSEALNEYKKLGVKRITLARELSLEQVKEIKKKTKLEIECFIHGAMCVAVSGRCLTSQFLYNRSANRGDCLQPCRRKYKVKDIETDKELSLDNNYVLSPKDMCALPFMDKLINAGIDAFKIEGRNRSPEYVKTVTECYRLAIDAVKNNSFDNKLIKILIEKLSAVYNRKFSQGFWFKLPTAEDFTDIYGSNATVEKQYIGRVKNYYKKINVAEIVIETGKLSLGDNIMIQGNKTGVIEQKVTSMQTKGKEIKKAGKGERIGIKTKEVLRPNDKVFLIRNLNK